MRRVKWLVRCAGVARETLVTAEQGGRLFVCGVTADACRPEAGCDDRQSGDGAHRPLAEAHMVEIDPIRVAFVVTRWEAQSRLKCKAFPSERGA
jgi:hypothetical protein